MKMTSLKGSIWRKWDLHIHTPASYHWNKSAIFYDLDKKGKKESIRKVIKAINNCFVDVLAITDYWTFDGYKKLRELESKCPTTKVVFPGIELRVEAATDYRLNLQIILSNELSNQQLDDFLSKLEIRFSKDIKKPLSEEALREYGSSLDDGKAKEQGFSPIKELKKRDLLLLGSKTAKITRGSLERALRIVPDNSAFVVMPWDLKGGLSGLDWKSHPHDDISLISYADFIESREQKTIDLFLHNKTKDNESFINDFTQYLKGRKIPTICGSDAHSLSDYGKAHNHVSCWIKADTTFEGLRQVKLEPKLRCKLQSDNPKQRETYAKINRLSVNLPPSLRIKSEGSKKTLPFCLSGTLSVNFSNNLTCIIGGRGSGKSAIIHLMYNSWINRSSGKLHQVDSPLISLGLTPEPLSALRNITKVVIPKKTEFFLQNEIEKIAKSIPEMSEMINARLYGRSQGDVSDESIKKLRKEWQASKEELNDVIVAFEHIVSIKSQIRSIKQTVDVLEGQVDVMESEEYEGLQKKIKGISKKISKHSYYKNEFTQLNQKINSLLTFIQNLTWNKGEGKNTLKDLEDDLKKHIKKLDKKYKKTVGVYEKSDYPSQLILAKEKLRNYLKEKGLSEDNVEELTDANEVINEQRQATKKLKKEVKPSKKIYSDKNKVVDRYRKRFEAYNAGLKEAIKLLQKPLEEVILGDKKVTFETVFDKGKLMKVAIDYTKSKSPEKAGLRANHIEDVLFGKAEVGDFLENRQQIRKHVAEKKGAEKHKEIMQEMMNDDDILEGLHLKLLMEGFNINNVQVQTRLGGKLLRNTSFGERCAIAMILILIAGNNPIIIDQPEDHLDGKFISETLVPLIKKHKNQRQIILVTRDANLTIGSDVELMNILEVKNGKAEIIKATIENKKKREKYIWVLDGGREAFKRRERKYDIKSP